jgi:hypothetical protein
LTCKQAFSTGVLIDRDEQQPRLPAARSRTAFGDAEQDLLKQRNGVQLCIAVCIVPMVIGCGAAGFRYLLALTIEFALHWIGAATCREVRPSSFVACTAAKVHDCTLLLLRLLHI